MEIKINKNISIGKDNPCFIIAEIGQNHNGDIEIAKKLIDSCKEAGVDAVKFCKRHIPLELTKEAYDKPYIGPNSFGETYGKHREFLELNRNQHKELADYAKKKNLIYFSSACDSVSVDDMEYIGVPLYKIASRDLTNIPLIEYIAKTNKPIILSTGMASKEDIDDAIKTIEKYHKKIIILNCTSEYPCAYEHVNLKKMDTIKEKWGHVVGFSGHTIGIAIPVAAVARGAKVIEKHVTLARYMKGTDHAGSLEPDGLKKMVRDIRNVEKAIGSGKIEFNNFLTEAKNKLARSIVSSKKIKKGEVLNDSNITLKSPGNGLLWREKNKIIGKRAKQDINEDILLKEDFFE